MKKIILIIGIISLLAYGIYAACSVTYSGGDLSVSDCHSSYPIYIENDLTLSGGFSMDHNLYFHLGDAEGDNLIITKTTGNLTQKKGTSITSVATVDDPCTDWPVAIGCMDVDCQISVCGDDSFCCGHRAGAFGYWDEVCAIILAGSDANCF